MMKFDFKASSTYQSTMKHRYKYSEFQIRKLHVPKIATRGKKCVKSSRGKLSCIDNICPQLLELLALDR